jgi:hypothetical protein
MSRKRKPNRAERQRRQEKRAKNNFEDVVQDAAATFTCSHELAFDLAWQCGQFVDELDGHLMFHRIAAEMWRGHTGDAKEFAQAVIDFLAERERQRSALSDLEERFRRLADANVHEHLDSIESHRELVRVRLTSAITPQSVNSEDGEARPSDLHEF